MFTSLNLRPDLVAEDSDRTWVRPCIYSKC